jgi:3-deoxy-D-manno-octulosonic-acid transferase
MRRLYSAAWWFAMPLVLARLLWRSRKEPGYRRHVGERFGFYGACKPPLAPLIWVHAVSVGETRAAEPLIEALLKAYPGHALLLTHMTPTGRATGRTLFAHEPSRIVQCYLPYDTGWMLRRFLRRFAPHLCILIETEVWPNLVAECGQHGVPVALVNARLSERSLARGRRMSGLMVAAAKGIACVAAQSEADAERIRMLGAPKVVTTGNIKFDVAPAPQAIAAGDKLRAAFGTRAVLLCASTREGEEQLILDACAGLLAGASLLVIVPRHPQRFDEVERMVTGRGLRCARRSRIGGSALDPGVQVLVGDSMGEMAAYYSACDIAFIGGSLLPLGGQNLIEACALGKPVLVGLHTFNFAVATEDAIAAGAAMRVANAPAMLAAAASLLEDHAARFDMGANARRFAERHKGATARTLALLRELIV